MPQLLYLKEEIANKEPYDPKDEIELEHQQELLAKLDKAKMLRDEKSNWFNDRTIYDYMDENEKQAISYIKPRKNDEWRTNIVGPDSRQKMDAIVTSIMDQNIEADIFAEGQGGEDFPEVATSLENLIGYSNRREHWDTKSQHFLYEMATNGMVYADINWVDRFRMNKKNLKWDKKSGKATWDEKEEHIGGEIETNLLKMDQVFLGNPYEFEITKQPHLFTYRTLTYTEARQIYGDWKSWKYVKPGMGRKNLNDRRTFGENYRISEIDSDMIEEIVYQCESDREYNVMLNSIPMLPPGFPMPWEHAGYSVTKRVYSPLSPHFWAGKSLMSYLRPHQKVFDWIYSMAVDKGRQSLMPPLANLTRTILGKGIFAPGRVTQGNIEFKSLINHTGVNQSEFEMLRFVEGQMAKASVSQTFLGQEGNKTKTAFEVRELQRQAFRLLGMSVFSYAWFVRDIAEIKAGLILENYPKQKIPVLDKDLQTIKMFPFFYSIPSVQTAQGKTGTRRIGFASAEEAPISEEIMRHEDMLAEGGRVVEEIYLNEDIIRNMNLYFSVVANPSQRRSKEVEELMAEEKYRKYKVDPLINQEWATREFVQAMGDDAEKALAQPQGQPMPEMVGAEGTQTPRERKRDQAQKSLSERLGASTRGALDAEFAVGGV